MKKIIILGIFLPLIFACVVKTAHSATIEEKTTEKKNTKIKISCVGDSITAGLPMQKEERKIHGYPEQLQKMLGEKYEVIKPCGSGRTLLREGKKSWMVVRFLMNMIKEQVPDHIVFMLGTNDTHNTHWGNKEKIPGDLKKYLADFRKINPKVTMHICLTPPSQQKDQTRIKEIIEMQKKFAKDNNLPVIDTYTPLLNKDKIAEKKYFADKLHPNKEGLAIIAKTVFTALTAKEKTTKKDNTK